MKAGLHSFKVTGEPGSTFRHVFMDGEELQGVRAATIVYEACSIPSVTLEFLSLDIEVDEPEAEVREEVVPCVGSNSADPPVHNRRLHE